MAKLSLIIPSHNRPDLLQLCLKSIHAHAPAETEVIVIDDASAHGEVSSVASSFDGVRVERLPTQSGFCCAVNRGLQLATAPIVELLNDDTQVSPNWCEAARKHFDNPQIAAVSPLVLQGIPDTQQLRIDSAGDRYYLGGVAGKRGHGEALSPRYSKSEFVFGASGSSAFYRRDVVIGLGGFPEFFGAYFEDVDLSFRLHWAGWQVVYEPASRVWHRVSASHGRSSWKLLAQQSRNEEIVFWRNVPSSQMGRALLRHLVVLLGKAWRRGCEGTLLPFLWGRLAVLGRLAEIRRHRRYLHRQRTTSVDEWHLEPQWWG